MAQAIRRIPTTATTRRVVGSRQPHGTPISAARPAGCAGLSRPTGLIMCQRRLGTVLGLRRAGRRTNLALLIVLVGAALTGGLAFAAGTSGPARAATIAHGLFGLTVVLLTPWKTVIARRAPALRVASLILLSLIVICVGSGLVEVFGGYGVLWYLSPIQVHVGSALLAAPLLAWHVLASPAATATPHRPVTPDAVAYRIVGRGGRDDLRRTRGYRRAGRICLSQQNRNWITQGRCRCHPGNDLALRHDPDRRPRPSCRYCRIHILDWRPGIALDDHRCAAGLHQRLVRRWGVDSCQPWRSSSAGAACRGGQHRGAQCDRLPTPIPG